MKSLTTHIQTKRALLWMNLSNEPFIVLYALLPFILRKDLGASLFQISILTALKPVLPLFSFYWSASHAQKKQNLKKTLITAWLLGRLPFLFIPWIHNAWYLIFCCATYEFFHKSGMPALIEILKINIPKQAREKTYTFYFVLSFLEGILLGLFMGGILDLHERSWQFLCCLTALFGLSSILLQRKIPIIGEHQFPPPQKRSAIKPWKEAFCLLKNRPDFAKFQWGFMTGGFGLMLIAPSLAIFYVDHLHLAHSQITTGRSIFMGIGIVASSYFWQKLLTKLSIPKLTTAILLGFGAFPMVLLLSSYHLYWFYLAFLFYGIAQAGSHLLWNLSGTLFADKEKSSLFSSVNILMVGIRGAVAPVFGGLSCQWLGPTPTLAIGAIICFIGAAYMSAFSFGKLLRKLTIKEEVRDSLKDAAQNE